MEMPQLDKLDKETFSPEDHDEAKEVLAEKLAEEEARVHSPPPNYILFHFILFFCFYLFIVLGTSIYNIYMYGPTLHFNLTSWLKQ